MRRRHLLKFALASVLALPLLPAAAAPVIEVYKTPTCGCCRAWVAHLQENGFDVKTIDVPDTAIYRDRFGIPEHLGSCHTGLVDGYALEGHVPAADIKRLLSEKPKAVGLAVPGMPLGSPGMDAAQKDPYNVVLVRPNGKHEVYRQYPAR